MELIISPVRQKLHQINSAAPRRAHIGVGLGSLIAAVIIVTHSPSRLPIRNGFRVGRTGGSASLSLRFRPRLQMDPVCMNKHQLCTTPPICKVSQGGLTRTFPRCRQQHTIRPTAVSPPLSASAQQWRSLVAMPCHLPCRVRSGCAL